MTTAYIKRKEKDLPVLQITVWRGYLERGDAPFAELIIHYLVKLDG